MATIYFSQRNVPSVPTVPSDDVWYVATVNNLPAVADPFHTLLNEYKTAIATIWELRAVGFQDDNYLLKDSFQQLEAIRKQLQDAGHILIFRRTIRSEGHE